MIKSKVKYAYALVFFYWPTIAYAKLSDVAGNVSGEARTILGEDDPKCIVCSTSTERNRFLVSQI
jgi:hypothetical protein